MGRARGLLLIAGALAACSGSGGEAPGLIRDFVVASTDPPSAAEDDPRIVVPQASVRLRWNLGDEVGRVVLTANEKELASFTGEIPDGHLDPCQEGACTTTRTGDIRYTLTAWDTDGSKDERSLRVRVSEQGLRVLSFLATPETIDPGGDVTLRWETAGATEATITAVPLGGGEERALGTFGAEGEGTARSGTLVDRDVQVSTLYRITIRGGGAASSAQLAVALRGEAWLTSLQADPPAVRPGNAVKLSWTSVGLGDLTIIRSDSGPTIADIGEEELAAGSRAVIVDRETTFSFAGLSVDGEPVTQLCDGTGCRPAAIVVEMAPGPSIPQFTSDDYEVRHGSPTTLRWNIENATSAELRWTDGDGAHVEAQAPAAGTREVAPGDTTIYDLRATDGLVLATARLTVGVHPAASLNLPDFVTAGGTLHVVWNTAGATLAELRVDGALIDTGGALDGTVDVPVPSDAAEGTSIPVELRARDNETPTRTEIVSRTVVVQ